MEALLMCVQLVGQAHWCFASLLHRLLGRVGSGRASGDVDSAMYLHVCCSLVERLIHFVGVTEGDDLVSSALGFQKSCRQLILPLRWFLSSVSDTHKMNPLVQKPHGGMCCYPLGL